MPVMAVLLGDLSYSIGVGPSNSLLRLAGNLCGHNSVKLGSIMNRVVNHVQGRLFLSLEGCYAIDSTALSHLVRQRKSLQILCRDMVLVDVPAPIRRVLEGYHFDTLFEIIPSLAEAERKYGRSVC